MTPIEEVRDLLAAAGTEVQYRTVASRAYFAAFVVAIDVATRRGFTPTQTGADHQNLIAFFKKASNSLLNRIGHHRLPRLRSLRNKADYDRGTPFPQGMAREAVETAEETIGWLNSLSS
jgi:hypothetical protein